jgi:D-3-phosphoglycerate dehydrogenase
LTVKIAVLDDYQNLALRLADWSKVRARAEIVVIDRAFASEDDAAKTLAPFDALSIMRERTPFPRALFERLPKLRFMSSTGVRNNGIDLAAATERGIPVSHTLGGPVIDATPEIAWGLLLAVARDLPGADAGMRRGHWHDELRLGMTLGAKRLGVVGLGKLGTRVAAFGKAFGMDVVAWSTNLTAEKAAAGGARLVSKDELFATSDVVSLHLVLSARSRGIVGREDLARMKPSAILINTSRGPLVDEAALIEALRAGRIFGAGLDVFDREPLPKDHPLRTLRNVVLAPHLGYQTEEVLRVFHGGAVENLEAWLDGKPIRLLNPDVKPRATS